jgi:hypothetical protein
MIDYFELTNYPNATPLKLDGINLISTQLKTDADGKNSLFYYLTPEAWAHSLELKRERYNTYQQLCLDEEWKLIDAAAAGATYAKTVLRLRADNGYISPTSRTISTSTEGLLTSNPVTGGLEYTYLSGKLTNCSICSTPMLVRNNRYRYCSPKCASQVKSERFARANAKRSKKERQKGICFCCGNTFVKTRSDAKFCSNRCRVTSHRANK